MQFSGVPYSIPNAAGCTFFIYCPARGRTNLSTCLTHTAYSPPKNPKSDTDFSTSTQYEEKKARIGRKQRHTTTTVDCVTIFSTTTVHDVLMGRGLPSLASSVWCLTVRTAPLFVAVDGFIWCGGVFLDIAHYDNNGLSEWSCIITTTRLLDDGGERVWTTTESTERGEGKVFCLAESRIIR